LIEREFYPLNKAAEMIGCTVDDLLHLGASGRIHIIILPTGLEGVMYVNDYSGQTVSGQPAVRSVQTINDRYCLVHKDFISKYEAAKSVGDGYSLGRMMTSDNSGRCWNLVHEDDYIPMSDTSLFVLTSDINSLRDTSTNEQTSSSKQLSEVIESAHVVTQVEAGAAAIKHVHLSGANWKLEARKIGKKIFHEKPNFSVEQIASKTREEMLARKNKGEPGMTGRSGKVPSAETIKRHALIGIKT
jgi:hypothetical protein